MNRNTTKVVIGIDKAMSGAYTVYAQTRYLMPRASGNDIDWQIPTPISGEMEIRLGLAKDGDYILINVTVHPSKYHIIATRYHLGARVNEPMRFVSATPIVHRQELQFTID